MTRGEATDPGLADSGADRLERPRARLGQDVGGQRPYRGPHSRYRPADRRARSAPWLELARCRMRDGAMGHRLRHAWLRGYGAGSGPGHGRSRPGPCKGPRCLDHVPDRRYLGPADPAATYDAIFGRCVLLFVPDPLAVLREFRRVLKPGGRIFVSVPGALSPIYNRSWRRFVEPGNEHNFMVPWELETLLSENGWHVLEQWGDLGRT